MTTKRLARSDALTEVILGVFRLNARLLEMGNQMVAPLGMTSARWQVLGAIALSGKAVSCPQIAAAMGVTRQGAQKQLHLAYQDQLVAIQENPHNLRSPLYELTAAGKDVYAKAMALQAVWSKSLAQGVTSSDWNTALNVLRVLDTRLQSTPLPKRNSP